MLNLRIQPRVWETVWFQVLMLFAVLLLIWLGFNWRLRQVRRRARMLEVTVEERTDELRVANEHLRDYSARLETASMTDPLTRLWNRRYLHSQLPADLAHFHRELSKPQMSGAVMAFAIVDIDWFKEVNDRYGHDDGDEVLQQFARLLEDLTRTGDYVVRWGGEEFLIVFRPMPTAEVPRVAGRIVDGIRAHRFMLDSGETLRLTASMGLAEYPVFRDSPAALAWGQTVTLADKALMYVKRRDRDGWCLVRPTPYVEPATLSGHLDLRVTELIEAEEISIETG
jgi:diguanylate cyclase (GGDEF)-like protein